jgi:predicted metal-dependent enzyme (double-stranded beta helix superfamily)
VLALALALSEWVERNKWLYREITSDDASKKTSLLQHYDSYSKLSKLGTWRRIQRLSLHSSPKFLLFIFIF